MPILLRPSELVARRTTAAGASGCRPAPAAAATTTGRRSAPVIPATGRATDALPALKPSQAGVKTASSSAASAQKTTGARRAATTNTRTPLPDAPRTVSPTSSAPRKELKHVNVFSSAAPQSRRRAASKKAIGKAKAEAAEKSMLFSLSSLKEQKSAHEVEMEGRRAQMRALGPVDATRR